MSLAGCLACAICTVLACSQILGDYSVSADPQDASAGGTGPTEAGFAALQFHDSMCRECMAQHCSDETAACLDKSDCAMVHRCWARCSPDMPGCRRACFADLARTDVVLGGVQMCAFERCHDACQVGFGSWRGELCETCSLRQCSELLDACAADPACVARLRCDWERDNVLHPNPGDVLACDNEHDAYKALDVDGGVLATTYLRSALCFVTGCLAECQFGGELDCPDYAWPPVPSNELVIPVRLSSSSLIEIPGPPLPGVEVKLCRAEDRDCSDPIDAGPTGDDGRSYLRFPRGENASVYFEAEVTDDLSGITTGLIFYPPAPITSDAELPLRVPVLIFDRRASQDGGSAVWTHGGSVFAVARTCLGAGAADVTFSLMPDPAATIRYSSYVGADSDTTSGFAAAFYDVPPGTYAIEARDAKRNIVARKADVIVRNGTRTNVEWLWPSP